MSIDPDNYVGKISPRQLIMIHTNNDSVVPLQNAEITLSEAKEPKELHVIDGCQHGYCDKMHDVLIESLEKIFYS